MDANFKRETYKRAMAISTNDQAEGGSNRGMQALSKQRDRKRGIKRGKKGEQGKRGGNEGWVEEE